VARRRSSAEGIEHREHKLRVIDSETRSDRRADLA
jgi:hypothetical protein